MTRWFGGGWLATSLLLSCTAPAPHGSRPVQPVAASASAAVESFPAPPPTQAFPPLTPVPARYLRSLEYAPDGYDAESGSRAREPSDLLLGDLLFHSPHTLGARARSLGMSCHSCHPNGASHTALLLENLSDRAGNVDLSTGLFRAGAEDGVSNPLNVPSLRGARYTAPFGRDGRVASLSEFISGVVVTEFDGEPLSQDELSALTRYVGELDFLPNANLDSNNRLTKRASPAARRGALLFRTERAGFEGMSCASCHRPSAFFRDGRVHRLGSEQGPSPHSLDGGYETPSLLGLAETAPYFHDGRFGSLLEVVTWFDEHFALGLSESERADLTAYIEAVGAVDQPEDDRPLARQLDHVFVYTALLSEASSRRIWIAAIDAVVQALQGEPRALSQRVHAERQRLTEWRRAVEADADLAPLASQARELRQRLARLAADWAGQVAEAGASR